MCGRYSQTQNIKDLEPHFQAVAQVREWTPRYNIAPMQSALVVTGGSERAIRLMRWGLVPSWAKDETMAGRLINARAESVSEKPHFKRPFARQRCLVVADGYYEWSKSGRTRQPWRYTLKEGPMMAFAGLWDFWPATSLHTFTVITTEANALARPVHDRMPAILAPQDYALWLDATVSDTARLQTLLKPFPDAAMQSCQVCTRVNSIQNDDPGCIEPLKIATPTFLPLDLPGLSV